MKGEERTFSIFERCKIAFNMVITFWLLMFLFFSELLLK